MRLNKRIIFFFVLVAGISLAAGFFTGFSYHNSSSPLALQSYDVGPANTSSLTDASKISSAPDSFSSTVSRVIDGDTLVLSSGERLRLIGIDAPESGNCFAKEATDALQNLTAGKNLDFKRDKSERDKYGRLLAYIYNGDDFLNMDLVEQGDAKAYPYSPDTNHASEFSQAEARAKSQKLGLWGACSAFNAPVSQTGSAGGCLIKGNISSSGEKIYHLPSCGSYGKTYINEASGEKWFCTEQEARAAGWRRAGNCP